MADRFYQYEINPVVELEDYIGGSYFEYAGTHAEAKTYEDEPNFIGIRWGAYGRKVSDNLVEWFADFATPEDAASLVSLIVGREVIPSVDRVIVEV